MIEEVEAYYRADQEWLIARSKALLNHAELAPDLRRAQADIDTEDLLRVRLEALVALEKLKIASEQNALAAARAGWESTTSYYGSLPRPSQVDWASPETKPKAKGKGDV